MNRREFVELLGMGVTYASGVGPYEIRNLEHTLDSLSKGEIQADIAVIGGGVGGCAAALAAARNGHRVVMTEMTDWIGGQLSQQGVPPDEHPWIEDFGATKSYREYRRRVRRYYRHSYELSSSGYRDRLLNPGNCSVSRICHEPRISLSVLRAMLQPYVSSGLLTILTNHLPVSASAENDSVRSVEVQDRRTNDSVSIEAEFFLDATELGDLLPLTDTEYVTGAESKEETGEPHAPSDPNPNSFQALTWCFAMDYVEGKRRTIEKPEMYGFWQDYEPDLTPPWPGKLLDFTYSNPPTLEPTTAGFNPVGETEGFNFWKYRRLIDPSNFEEPNYEGGICLVNWPQNDYWLGNIVDVDKRELESNLDQAKQLSRSLMYWLQTEAPRPDGGQGWPELRLRADVMGTQHTEHGLAKYPYVRESRRIEAEFTVSERHVGAEARMKITGEGPGEVSAARFKDSVGVGAYRIDLHPSTGGRNYVDFGSLPFQIPLGSLIPVRMENLIPACKNIGVTHIANGCYRLHPVEWNIGESAGLLSSFSIEEGVKPRNIYESEELTKEFQSYIKRQGVEIEWPEPKISIL